jgi:hypothetical protein
MRLFKFNEFKSYDKSTGEEIDLEGFSKSNKCNLNCDRRVVKTDSGVKVVCKSCKRLIRDIKKTF